MNKKTFLIASMLLLVGISYAQETRMKRDIEVAENILATLIQQETDSRFGSGIEGTYIEGQGALFTISKGSFLSYGYTIAGLRKDGVVVGRASKDRDRADAPLSPMPERWEINVDSMNEVMHEQLKAAMKTFMRDYAHLLTELTPNEKVIVRYNNDRQFPAMVYTTGSATGFFNAKEKEDKETLKEITAEVEKASIDQYRNGQLSAKQFEERIKFKELTTSNKSYADLELLSSIFNRLYQRDLTESFRIFGSPRYEKIEGLGVIYTMKFGEQSSILAGFPNEAIIVYNGRVTREQDVPRDKRSEAAESKAEKDEDHQAAEKYPGFIEGFKENIIEYGRTVKSLTAAEVLIFKINLDTCYECDIPANVELSIKKSVLEAYDKNEISLEQAIAKITMKTIEK